jgi:hypothetical protein
LAELLSVSEVISVTTNGHYPWQPLYEAALLELDPAKLPERVEQAFTAIQTYMQVAGYSSNGDEQQALADALANLRVLRREAGLAVNDSSHKEPGSPAPDL